MDTAWLGRILSREGEAAGTCFQVEDRILVTAWHVVDEVGSGEVGDQVDFEPLTDGEPAAAVVTAVDAEHDLAVLTVSGAPLPASIPGLLLSASVPMRTDVSVTGVSELEFDEVGLRYKTALGLWSSSAMRSDGVVLGVVESKGVLRGMSGAPVVTDAGWVIGVLSARYNSADGWARDTVWLARSEEVARLLDGHANVTVHHAWRADRDDDVRGIAGQRNRTKALMPHSGLIDRGSDREEVEVFCQSDVPYLVVSGPPWSGKTALLADIALNPPEDVDVVSFFVNGRVARDSDGAAFTDVVLGQLTEFLALPPALPSEPRERETQLAILLARAAARARSRERTLTLIVDGLDEDRSGAGQPEIATLLPAVCPSGLHVLVSTRSNYQLPSAIAADHPMRTGQRLVISPVSAARVQRSVAEDELRALLADNSRRVPIAALAASGGGLTGADLAELTGVPPYEITEAFAGVAARTVVRRSGPGAQSAPHEFAHERLLEAARSAIGEGELLRWRVGIEEWAQRYRDAGWPVDTPRYLLTDIGRLLAREGPRASALIFATDARRHERTLDLVEGHAASLREIDAVAARAVAEQDDSVETALAIAVERHEVAAGHAVPFRVASAYAAVGRSDRAEALARSAGSPQDVTRALVALSVSLVGMGQIGRAEAIVGHAATGDWADAAFARMTRAAARAGNVDGAKRLVARVVSAARAEPAYTAMIRASADVGRFDEAEEWYHKRLTRLAERAKGCAAIATAYARRGQSLAGIDRAAHESDLNVRADALIALARVAASRGDVAALGAIDELVDESHRSDCIAARLPLVFRQAGTSAALDLIASLPSRLTPNATTQLAVLLVGSGELEPAEALVRNSQTRSANAEHALAVAAAEIDAWNDAERIAAGIRKAERRANAIGAVARAAASRKKWLIAERLAYTIAKPEGTAVTLANIARVGGQYGQDDLASRLADTAERTYREHRRAQRIQQARRALAESFAEVGDGVTAHALLQAANVAASERTARRVVPALIASAHFAEVDAILNALGERGRAAAEAAAASAFAARGDVRRVEALLHGLEPGPQAVVAMSSAAVALARSGHRQPATTLANRAAEAARELVGRPSAEDAVVSVARALTVCGDVDAGLALAELPESVKTRDAATAQVAIALAKADRVDDGRALVARIANRYRDRFRMVCLGLYVEAGEVDRAFQELEFLTDHHSAAAATALLAREVARSNPALARGFLQDAARQARRTETPARTLGATAAAGYGPETAHETRMMVVEALTLGVWTEVLPAVARVDRPALDALALRFLADPIGPSGVGATVK